jgi:DNA-binding GntR family transcriptional regulator
VDVPDGPISRPEPLRAEVYRRVVRLMTAGELEPGQTITEASLSKSLGVSRTPVREALLQLEAEGVVQSTPARGFTVRDLSRTEATELYPILATLEALAVTSTTKPFDVNGLRELNAKLIVEDDPITRWKLDTAFHETMIAAADNENLKTMITRLRVTLSRYEIEYMRTVGGAWKHASGNRHAAIVDALAKGDRAAAAKAVALNWQQSLHAVRTWLAPISSRDG